RTVPHPPPKSHVLYTAKRSTRPPKLTHRKQSDRLSESVADNLLTCAQSIFSPSPSLFPSQISYSLALAFISSTFGFIERREREREEERKTETETETETETKRGIHFVVVGGW
ncbi:hypothetical protein F2P56_017097, partial [Juglans regia]